MDREMARVDISTKNEVRGMSGGGSDGSILESRMDQSGVDVRKQHEALRVKAVGSDGSMWQGRMVQCGRVGWINVAVLCATGPRYRV